MTEGPTECNCVSDLEERLIERLRVHLAPGSRCALLGFADHGNVGDSAIWLGTLRILPLLDVELVYAGDVAALSNSEMRRRLRGGVLLLTGGGDFGDTWPNVQRVRERIMTTYTVNRIVQLPQSIRYLSGESSERTARLMAAHGGVTVLARDKRSFEFARQNFPVSTDLVPDMAFGLGALRRHAAAQVDSLWLMRDDRERNVAESPNSGPKIEVHDWVYGDVEGVHRRMAFSAASRSYRGLSKLDVGARLRAKPITLSARVLATLRLQRGLQLLGRGRVVVTDRLHGHILSLLLGIPNVVLDNSYGKNSAFVSTWTRDCPIVATANNVGEAHRLLATLDPG